MGPDKSDTDNIVTTNSILLVVISGSIGGLVTFLTAVKRSVKI